MHVVVFVACLLVFTAPCGCASSSVVSCSDGRVCPTGKVCDLVHSLCVTPAQTVACDLLVDGVRCEADGLSGICDRGFCVPGCGDGISDEVEQCDDGNFASHDGCSSTCLLETPSWIAWRSPWMSRTEHAAVYHAQAARIVLFGGDVPTGKSDEHWEYDGSRWTERGGAKPSPRSMPAVAYDSNRHRVVMFGGGTGNTDLGDTWEYDGTTWFERTPLVVPSPRRAAAAVFDDVRDRVIMFGGIGADGALNETWEYDGTTWVQMTPTLSPAARTLPSFVWDPVRMRAVQHGVATFGDETWEYDAGTWTKVPKQGTWPQGRHGAAAAYWPTFGVVLFGGVLNTQVSALDTWAFDGSAWTQIPVGTTAPPGRSNATLTPLPGQGLVLVGGTTGPAAFDDAWTFDGISWRETSPRFAPIHRATQMVADERRREVVLFGGNGLVGRPLADTWLFDGTSWEEATPSGAPAGFGASLPVLAYDSRRGRVVRFGGRNGNTTFSNETYEWDGAGRTWTAYNGTTKPPAREGGALTYDPVRGVVVLFGGAVGMESRADTWEYDGATWTDRTNAIHPPAQKDPAMAFDPHTQRSILVDQDGDTWAYEDGGWTELTLPRVPARSGAMLTYYRERDRLVLFGGYSATELFADLWELDSDGWHEVEVVGELPPGRSQGAFAAHPAARTLVIYGGFGPNGRLDDTWSLQYRSATEEEVCGNAVDDDADLQVDDADPDCPPPWSP